jgi:hypothetical protein
VSTSGVYTFTTTSTIDDYGYFYNNTFTPSNVSLNLVAQNDDSGGSLQFLISLYLQGGRSYTLVITTYSAGVQGTFLAIASGPAMVGLSGINIQSPSTTTTTQSTTTTRK